MSRTQLNPDSISAGWRKEISVTGFILEYAG